MYEIKERVRYSEVRENGKMGLLGIVNLLQDCSTFHSHDVGMSIEKVLELKRAWLLSAWDIQVFSFPALYEEITVGTSPHLFRGIFAYRNFWIRNKEGEYLVKADSEWFCIDTEKGRPQKITEELVEPFGKPEDVLQLPPLQRKIIFPEELLFQSSGRPAFSFSEENKKERMEPFGIRAEYLKAYTLGDHIFPRLAIEEDRKVVAFYNQNKELCCHVEIRKIPKM